MRPVVGLLCCNEHHRRDVQVVATRFIRPLAEISGASALLVPAVTDACDVRAIAARLDALLLTGSQSNVAARRYGGAFDLGPCDEARDDVALRLAAAMIETGKPVFGICRGFQELNALFGGTLTGDLPAGFHHAGGNAADDGTDAADFARLFDHAHEIRLHDGGTFRPMLGKDAAEVNSVHRQGVDRLGRDLIVEATAHDGLVEAFWARPCGAEVLAVQWHPEWSTAAGGIDRLFFERFRTALGNPATI